MNLYFLMKKFQYKANVNEAVGILKDRFVFALTLDSTEEQKAMIQDILAEIGRYVVPIRDDRQQPRNPNPRKSKFHHNRRANC